MPENAAPNDPAKPANKPVEVREPDNKRPPNEPAPRNPEKPQEMKKDSDEPDTDGM